MNVQGYKYSFIYDCACFCWCDVLWGYERDVVGWEFVVGIADFFVSNGSDDELEIELVFLEGGDIEEIENKMRQLAEKCSVRQSVGSRDKWVFVLLKWLFENKDSISDPLGEVEVIYEDFDFPQGIESFVRYMPSVDNYKPEKHSADDNQNRIFDNWSSYLKMMEASLQGK